MRALASSLLLITVVITATAAARPSKHKRKHARHRSHEVAKHVVPAAARGHDHTPAGRFETPTDPTGMPAYRYARLSQADCEAALATRKIAFVRETANGVAQPVRLTGPLHGVTFHASVAKADRATTPYEIGDCRLVLALDDFAAILAGHGVVEVVHYSMYRPLRGADAVATTKHNAALAIDAAHFVKQDGTQLTVLDDFHGAIDAKTCGDGAAPDPATEAAVELRAILCEAVAQHLFNVVLTPNYNEPHRNHFHLEVTPNVSWFLVH